MLVPALPGCVTYGKTVEEAIEMSRDAITGYVESLIEDGEPSPCRPHSSHPLLRPPRSAFISFFP